MESQPYSDSTDLDREQEPGTEPEALTRPGPSPEEYGPDYYGQTATPSGNYRDYGPHSEPHWSKPLARWLAQQGRPPYLDLGAAFGHLVRDLAARGLPALAVEWSETAHEQRVVGFGREPTNGNYLHQDARAMLSSWLAHFFGTVTSLDFLEHFEPEETETIIREVYRVTRPAGLSAHLVGAHNPKDSLSNHMSDPTHRNHNPLAWYREAFQAAGFVYDAIRTQDLNANPAWRGTDWNGRWLVFTKPEEDAGDGETEGNPSNREQGTDSSEPEEQGPAATAGPWDPEATGLLPASPEPGEPAGGAEGPHGLPGASGQPSSSVP